MVKITREGNGFKMLFSDPGSGRRGFSTRARDLAEVKAAIDHYLGGEGNLPDYNPNVPVDGCPLCRDIEAKKPKRMKQ